ncbi:MAG: hypothetical protein KGQ59_06030 [Bdellovibrionales bacterium]|nr:hypothetical protein [Bdellovibrionales bacterium]
MDVSQKTEIAENESGPVHGDTLVRSIVAITGLPDSSVRSELVEMLSMKDQPSNVTPDLSAMSLDDLRSAMLVYLESINADMMARESDGSDDVPNS